MISFKKANDITQSAGKTGCDPALRRARCRTARDDSETFAGTVALVPFSQTFAQGMPAKLERPAPHDGAVVDKHYASRDLSADPQFPYPVNRTSVLAATSLSPMRKDKEPVLEASRQDAALTMAQASWPDATLRSPEITATASIDPAVRMLGLRHVTSPSIGAESNAEPTPNRGAGIQPDLPIVGRSAEVGDVREMWHPRPDEMKRHDRQSKLTVTVDRAIAADSALADGPHADNRALALAPSQAGSRPTGRRDPSFLFSARHGDDEPILPHLPTSSRSQDSRFSTIPDQQGFPAMPSRPPQTGGLATSVESLPAGTADIRSGYPGRVITDQPQGRPLEDPGATSDTLEPLPDAPDGLSVPDLSSAGSLAPSPLPISPARQIVSALSQATFPVPRGTPPLDVNDPHKAATHTINLELYPADLGRVVVTIRFKDKKVSLHIATETSDAATAIDHDSSTLDELALRAGLDSVEATIVVASRPLPAQPQPLPDRHDVATFGGPGEYGWQPAGGKHADQGGGHQQSSKMTGGTHGEEERSRLVSPGRGPDVHRRGIFL